MRAREKGGTGGVVPHWHVAKLLEHARSTGIKLSAKQFAPCPPLSRDADLPKTASAHA